MDELADLFQARSRFVEALAEEEDPLGRAREVLAKLPEEDRRGAGPPSADRRAEPQRPLGRGAGRGRRSGGLAELAELNAAYEERFGFRFVVFVDRRPRAEIVPVLRERLERTREELETAATSSSRSRWTGGGAPEGRLRQAGRSVYRTDGVSSLFAAEIGMTARGEAFDSLLHGGRQHVVVATDSMKNFIQIAALEYEEARSRASSSFSPAASWTRTARSSGSSSRPARCRSPAAASSRSRASAATRRGRPRSTATGRSSTAPAARACG